VNLGLIDTPEKAVAAGHDFRTADVDLIFLHVTTYALSSTVLPVVRRAKVPVIILNLSLTAAIDCDWFNSLGDRTKTTGEWLAYCQACPVAEIANVFNCCKIPFFQVTGTLENDSVAANEIAEWVGAARVAHTMEHSRLGVMGHYYRGMLDIYSDFTQHCTYFGGRIEVIEVDELAALRRQVSDSQIEKRVRNFRKVFDIQPDCLQEELNRAARTSVALDRLVELNKLGSLAYYYQGTGNTDNKTLGTKIPTCCRFVIFPNRSIGWTFFGLRRQSQLTTRVVPRYICDREILADRTGLPFQCSCHIFRASLGDGSNRLSARQRSTR
jgi:L-arabinose isomerase